MEKFHTTINKQLINLNITRRIQLTRISPSRSVRRLWCIGIGLYRLSHGSRTNSPFRPFPRFVPR